MQTQDKPLISVIIPAYNSEKYIAQCLDSIIRQTYKNIEIVIIDDGSTDNTNNILKSYESNHDNIKLILKSNGGVSSARNLGLKEAKGEYIALQDADDISLSDRLESQMKYLQDSTADVCGTGIEFFGDKKNKIRLFPEHDAVIKYNCLFHGRVMAGPTAMFRKSSIVGLTFDENEAMGEDYQFFLRCFLEKNLTFHNIQQPLYQYRVSTNQASKKLKDITQESIVRIQNNLFKKSGILTSKSLINDHYKVFKTKSFKLDNTINEYTNFLLSLKELIAPDSGDTKELSKEKIAIHFFEEYRKIHNIKKHSPAIRILLKKTSLSDRIIFYLFKKI